MRIRYKTTRHNGIGDHTCKETNSSKTVMKIELCEIRWLPNIKVRKIWLMGNSNLSVKYPKMHSRFINGIPHFDT